MIVWEVPISLTRFSEGDANTTRLASSGEACEDDVEGFDKLIGATPIGPIVKTEPVEAVPLNPIVTFKKGIPYSVRELTDMELNMKVIHAKSTSDESGFADTFKDAAVMHMTNLKKALDILQKLMVEDFEVDKVTSVTDTMERVKAEHVRLVFWAVKFGFHVQEGVKRARKKV